MGLPGQGTCGNVPFTGTQSFQIPYASTVTKIQRVKANHFTLDVCRRPAMPLYGLKENAAPLAGTYDFLPSTKGHENVFILIAEACFNASKNWVQNNNIGADNFFTPETQYGSYLYDKFGSSQCLMDRFLEAYNKTRQFFTLHAAIAAFDIALYKELQDLQEKIMEEVDKQSFIPPGIYSFDGSAAGIALQAWLTADATLSKLYSLELVTT